MDTNTQPAASWSPNSIDALFTKIDAWWDRLTQRPPTPGPDIAFTDEWERKFIEHHYH